MLGRIFGFTRLKCEALSFHGSSCRENYRNATDTTCQSDVNIRQSDVICAVSATPVLVLVQYELRSPYISPEILLEDMVLLSVERCMDVV